MKRLPCGTFEDGDHSCVAGQTPGRLGCEGGSAGQLAGALAVVDQDVELDDNGHLRNAGRRPVGLVGAQGRFGHGRQCVGPPGLGRLPNRGGRFS